MNNFLRHSLDISAVIFLPSISVIRSNTFKRLSIKAAPSGIIATTYAASCIRIKKQAYKCYNIHRYTSRHGLEIDWTLTTAGCIVFPPTTYSPKPLLLAFISITVSLFDSIFAVAGSAGGASTSTGFSGFSLSPSKND